MRKAQMLTNCGKMQQKSPNFPYQPFFVIYIFLSFRPVKIAILFFRRAFAPLDVDGGRLGPVLRPRLGARLARVRAQRPVLHLHHVLERATLRLANRDVATADSARTFLLISWSQNWSQGWSQNCCLTKKVQFCLLLKPLSWREGAF